MEDGLGEALYSHDSLTTVRLQVDPMQSQHLTRVTLKGLPSYAGQAVLWLPTRDLFKALCKTVFPNAKMGGISAVASMKAGNLSISTRRPVDTQVRQLLYLTHRIEETREVIIISDGAALQFDCKIE